jgi:Cdc6-like AAA superfamily ATPase
MDRVGCVVISEWRGAWFCESPSLVKGFLLGWAGLVLASAGVLIATALTGSRPKGAFASIEGASFADDPISSPSEDLFERGYFVRRLSDLIRNTFSASTVIGLYGPWGAGKTSVLNLVQRELEPDANIVVVRFDSWHFTGERNIITAFFEELDKSISESLRSLALTTHLPSTKNSWHRRLTSESNST